MIWLEEVNKTFCLKNHQEVKTLKNNILFTFRRLLNE